jgi:hypothetical protein
VFAQTPFESMEMLEQLRRAVLNYGVCIGVLAQIKNFQKTRFFTDEITIGYPITNEVIVENGQNINVSSGSQPDSNTRTKSCILAWLVTCGFIIPEQLKTSITNPKLTHIQVLDYVLDKNRSLRNYELFEFPNEIFKDKFIVSNPLDYHNFTKNTGALRENGQQISREITMKFENVIKNRRLAIVYTLNKAYNISRSVNFDKLITFLERSPAFIINNQDFRRVMQIELNFANTCGIPFEIYNNLRLKPLVGVNEKVLLKNAPIEIIKYLNKFKNYE